MHRTSSTLLMAGVLTLLTPPAASQVGSRQFDQTHHERVGIDLGVSHEEAVHREGTTPVVETDSTVIFATEDGPFERIIYRFQDDLLIQIAYEASFVSEARVSFEYDLLVTDLSERHGELPLITEPFDEPPVEGVRALWLWPERAVALARERNPLTNRYTLRLRYFIPSLE